MNASDTVAAFIEYCKIDGVSKEEFLKLPMELFIKFLIIMAAKQDDESLPEDITLIEDVRIIITQNRQLAAPVEKANAP